VIPLPICILLIFAFGLWAVALYPRRACSVCGRNRAGRMAGGTIDNPICIDCINDGNRSTFHVAPNRPPEGSVLPPTNTGSERRR